MFNTLQPYAIETTDIIDPETNKIIGQERIDTNVSITDISPFEHTVTSKNINLSDEDICIFAVGGDGTMNDCINGIGDDNLYVHRPFWWYGYEFCYRRKGFPCR